jgi:hypothetical protein
MVDVPASDMDEKIAPVNVGPCRSLIPIVTTPFLCDNLTHTHATMGPIVRPTV